MYQPSLYSIYSAVIPALDSGWYVAGNVVVDNSFYSYGLLRKLDNNGSVLMEAQVQVPGYERTGINALATTSAGTLLVAGVASAGCDYGPFEALLSAFTDSGTPLWQHRYAVEPAQDMAVNDSLIALIGYPYLLFTDLNGDSLHQTSVDYGYGERVRANSAGFVCLGYQGVFQVMADGTSGDPLEGVNAIDLVELSNGQQVLLTEDSILLLTSGLERTGIGASRSSPSYSGWLSIEGPGVRVTDEDSTYLFDSILNLIESHSLELPSGFNTLDVQTSDSELVSVGYFNSGAFGAAIRSQPLTGPESPLDMDIALSGLSVDSVQLTYFPISNGVYFHGPIWLHGWVKNHGDLPVDHLTLDQVLPYGICSAAGFNYPFEGLGLTPGDSLYMAMGPFAIYDAETENPNAPTHRNICIWAACPDNRLDRNGTDNQGCVDLLIPLGVDELQAAARLKVYPNPAADHVIVELPELISPSMAWSLTDLMGRKVSASMQVTGERSIRLDLGELVQGSYALSINNGTARWSRLVVRK